MSVGGDAPEVAPDAERRPLARQHDRTHALVAGDLLAARQQRLGRLRIERVVALGTPQFDEGHRPILDQSDSFAHGVTSLPS